jgi:hypothetical protein
MAKARANLTVDPAVWDAALEFFGKHPEMGSISSFFETTLKQFLQIMPPFVERAKAGDRQAATALLQMGFNVHMIEGLSVLNQLYSLPSEQSELFQKPKVKGGRRKKTS